MSTLFGASSMMLGSSAVLSRLWHIGIQSEKLKSAEYKQSEVDDAISRITAADSQYGLRVAGPLLLGVARLYARRVDMYESRIHAVSAHIESVLHSSVGGFVIASSARKSSVAGGRKRGQHSVNLLPSLPEAYSLDDMPSLVDEVMFEPMAHTPARTPSSRDCRSGGSRRFRVSTPTMPEDDFAFDTAMTPVDDLSGKRRRLSSVSEVMDSLRADDGTRRMSGILGSMTDMSLPGTPLIFEDASDGLGLVVPESPWPMQPVLHDDPVEENGGVARVPLRNRVTLSFLRKMVDKKGKHELEKSKLAERKQELALVDFSIADDVLRTAANYCIFPLSMVMSDRSSHFKWFVPEKVRRISNTKTNHFLDQSEFPPDFDGGSLPEEPVQQTPTVRLPEKASLASVVIAGRKTKKSVATEFVDLLLQASRGAVRLAPGPVDFANATLGKRAVVRVIN